MSKVKKNIIKGGRPKTAATGLSSVDKAQQEEEKKKEEQLENEFKKEMMRHVANEDGELPLIFQKNPIFLIFESELQAEIFNSRCQDTGEHITADKAKVFKEEFNVINNKKTPQILNLQSMRLGVNTMVTLSSILQNKNPYDTLNLADNAISDYGMHSIKSIITNTKIKHLNLASNMISEQGLEIIVDELSKSTALRTLDLGVLEGSIRKNSFGVDGAKCLAAVILQNKFLETLKLQDNDIGITGGEILGTALKQNRTLKHLTIAENDLKMVGAEFILRSAIFLESLDLGKNYIKAGIGPSLKDYVEKNQNLKRLNLEYNELLAVGIEYLTIGLSNSNKIKSLSVKGNGIRDEGLELISNFLQENRSLEELDISLNEITPIGIQHLAQILPQTNIKTLCLSKNLLGDESLVLIADNAIMDNYEESNRLSKIDISSSRVADSGILHFLEKLEFFPNMKSIKATDNFISEKIEKILLEILEKNRTLIEFAVQGNRLSLCCMNRIKKILQRNNKEREEKEPNKIRTEIYRLKYEQKKIMAQKQKLENQEKEINKLEEKKTNLSLNIDKLRVTEQGKRQQLTDKIHEQQNQIERKKKMIEQKNEEFIKKKEQQEQELKELKDQFQKAEEKRKLLQDELEKINNEMTQMEIDYQNQIKSLEQQMEEQKQKKEEMDKKTLDLNTEFSKLLKQEKELNEQKATLMQQKEKEQLELEKKKQEQGNQQQDTKKPEASGVQPATDANKKDNKEQKQDKKEAKQAPTTQQQANDKKDDLKPGQNEELKQQDNKVIKKGGKSTKK